MAGGKQSPRQKMINLMYLIFIAMLAMNMSKEVLQAFGLMNEKLETSNAKMTENNLAFFEGLETKASENLEEYGELFKNAQEVSSLSSEYYSYLEDLKKLVTAEYEDPKSYLKMDKGDFLDNYFFQGDNFSPEGQKFLDMITSYREGVLKALPEGKLADVRAAVETRFKTGDENGKVERVRDGVTVDWLNYNFEGYPAVASLTKISALQADIKTTEQEVLKGLLEGNLTAAVSLKNFATALEASKSAFYSGEKYDGKIIISKTDRTSTPVKAELTMDGRKLTEGQDYRLEAGGIQMLVDAGSAGDHEIKGTMIFMQDGEEIPVEVNNSFATINKPNDAVISAEAMNVVYRGIPNPMNISIPGIPDNKVTAAAPGLSKRSGSKYVMKPGSGRTVSITASGTLPDGQTVRTTNEFRIKDIPSPTGAVRGESGVVKMPKSSLEKATVGAVLEDFVFDLNIAVSSFKITVPGQPTVAVNGNRLNAQAKSVLKRARRGDAVQIYDIKAYITNNKSYKLKNPSPVIIELTN